MARNKIEMNITEEKAYNLVCKKESLGSLEFELLQLYFSICVVITVTLLILFLVEDMNYQGLQKRSKKTEISEKTGRYKKKKRYGKSLLNYAPAMLLTIIDTKLKYYGEELIKIDTIKVKASQYNHIEDTYKKKKLSERWNILGDNKVQRDLYSAFIIKNVKDDLKSIDRNKMIKEYSKFLELHNKEIERIKNSDMKTLKCMGF